MPDDPALRFFPDEYVPNAQGVDYHKKWVAANKNGDAPKWAAFRDAILGGGAPSPPSMATRYGKALVAAGKQHMSISRLTSQPAPPYPGPTPPPVPPPDPPPGGIEPVPWMEGATPYRYEISLTPYTNPPAPEVVFNSSTGTCALTCTGTTPIGPFTNPDRQLVAAYINSGALAVQGRRVRYEWTQTFPASFRGTPGELNFWFEWHTSNNQLSCAIGGRCDFPGDGNFHQPGNNLTWFFRPIGPSGSPPLSEMIGPSIPFNVESTWNVKVEVLWSSSNSGEFRVFLNGVQQRFWNLPTMWAGDDLGLGIYHYRIRQSFSSTIHFSKPIITII